MLICLGKKKALVIIQNKRTITLVSKANKEQVLVGWETVTDDAASNLKNNTRSHVHQALERFLEPGRKKDFLLGDHCRDGNVRTLPNKLICSGKYGRYPGNDQESCRDPTTTSPQQPHLSPSPLSPGRRGHPAGGEQEPSSSQAKNKDYETNDSTFHS